MLIVDMKLSKKNAEVNHHDDSVRYVGCVDRGQTRDS